MNKIFAINLSLVILSIVVSQSAFADSGSLKNVNQTSLNITSMVAGAVVGTPIAIVRKTGSQYEDSVKEFRKDSNAYKFWGALCSAPVAAVAGPIKGTICGINNAVHYSFNQPFDKDTFSLGSLEDVPKTTAKTNLQSNPDKPESQPWGTANASVPASTTPQKNKLSSKSSLSQKALSVAAAFFVGTPVCIVRRTKYEEWYGVRGLIGDSESKCKKILAGMFWLPFAAMYGTGEAPFDAVSNGLMYPAFSKDQLSQGKLIQNN